jgi:hypothetical protein
MNYAPDGKRRLKGSQGSGWWMFVSEVVDLILVGGVSSRRFCPLSVDSVFSRSCALRGPGLVIV